MLSYYEKKGLVFNTLLAFGVLVLLAHPAAPGSNHRPWVSVTATPITLATATDAGARSGPLAARSFVELERPGLGGLLLGGLLLGGLPLLRQLGLDVH